MINGWNGEHKYTEFSDLQKFTQDSAKKKPQIGHFTQLVQRDVAFIGCAGSVDLIKINNTVSFHLVCNYSFGNLIDHLVVKTDKSNVKKEPGWKCAEISSRYAKLCKRRNVKPPTGPFYDMDEITSFTFWKE